MQDRENPVIQNATDEAAKDLADLARLKAAGLK